ncbi:type I restriction-modification system subunit M [Corynebacterium glutamicum]|uniref:type I restriction-modification system subunit M n=1 Tax=Corynebacterium glutamicum TaxID=1718 RepID=UPI0009444653|nr:class I SAM-dependent DNA methyltransferase [Corynebacterium glutamicum]OKX88112.1 restriction endonuclease [Corynebacterium glutamicum]QDX74818.1 restriction endonuclease [Corynebacterium glutamicum]QDX77581.1 restriction endonuclease [Corynebacterium glutamicum]TWS33827.1 restriction endonuclease [Corynebacterium glutamicum]TWS34294.1 restriction endonuclease [Corynebacterium glutamicum]
MASSASLHQAVWQTADTYLRGVVPRQSYGDYILPFTVLRRLECLLEPTKAEVLQTIKHTKFPESMWGAQIRAEHNLSFYNTSELSMGVIGGSDDHVKKGMLTYLDAFSDNARDVWTAFKFPELLNKLEENNVLWGVVKHFSNIDLSDDALGENSMGELFENLMYRSFSENGQVAGEFYTPRDAIRLMVDVLLSSDDDGLYGQAPARTVYDPAAGTGGMLLVAKRAMEELNPKIQVSVYGQELMAESLALGKSDLIVSGISPDAIRDGDTLADDRYEGEQYDYVLSNPPYGSSYVRSKDAVERESKIEGSRFSHGLPPVSDGQMLFLSHVVHKLKEKEHGTTKGGRAGVVTNGSPLFTGAPESGADKIRNWLINGNLIDAIIALPTDMFYNTGIATYVWILDKNKEAKRDGKIQLIDATGTWTAMRKSMGSKRRELSETDREFVLGLYNAFEDADPDYSKIVTPDELGFIDVPMYRVMRYSTLINDETVAAALDHKQALTGHEAVVRSCEGIAWNDLPNHLKKAAKDAGLKMSAGLLGHIMNAVAVEDPDAPEAIDHKGNKVIDKASKITERIPLTDDVDEHMESEVLPFAPDLVWDMAEAKTGYEIPMTRLFYKPEVMPSLDDLDVEIETVLESIRARFLEVKE